ncbi:hypothetical protein PGTUg99_023042 [Puccinia graminis f. sp. tritici]|nr:hypothetical protein PGTUg99_023042 [Puccinia graminis f. sp. tritici]
MAVELRKIIDSYNLLSKTLDQLSALWKPDDPLNHEKNKMLFNIVKSLLGRSLRISSLARRDNYGWTAVSISTISFYLASTIAAGQLLKRTLLIATGKKPLWEKQCASHTKRGGYLNQSISTVTSKAESEVTKPMFVICNSTQRLQRGYHFIYISCVIMLAVLGLNICISVILALKTKVVLIQTDWQIRLLVMISSTSVLLSFTLFLQSLMLLVWG